MKTTEKETLKTDRMETEYEKPAKKSRKLYAKEFRQKLKTIDGLENVKQFVDLYNSGEDYTSEFFDSGGNLSELVCFIELLDSKISSQILPTFQAISILLLEALSKKSELLPQCEESCRELLTKHYSIIKNMLSLNSTSKQRKVALKLLSTMTTLSVTVAKDVLSYASFDPHILEILTNPGTGEESSSVRISFIHFLLSFLIDGNTTIIASFLEKRGLLTCIFNGLLYDKSETVQLVLTTIQKRILEDKYLSKTLKMQTFNTQVIKSLVNLYNWKGPDIGKKTGNYKKRMSQMKVVDPIEKEIVCDCVHQFLLILCTSKFGVIFRDPTIGLSGKQHNSLMLTVLQGLEKPWDHPKASELVKKICFVCPDLVRPVLKDVTPFLEPRTSQKWLNAIRFVTNVIGQLTSKCIGSYFEKMTLKQITQVIQTLCVPHNILCIINKENLQNNHLGIRYEILKLLNIMCNTVSDYFNYIDKLLYFTDKQKNDFKNVMTNYLDQNLPSLEIIMNAWKNVTIDEIQDPDIPIPNLNQYYCIILDILYGYYTICPNSVDDIAHEIDPLKFFETITNDAPTETISDVYIKAIDLFLLCDSNSLLPNGKLFDFVLPKLLKIYSESKNYNKNNEINKMEINDNKTEDNKINDSNKIDESKETDGDNKINVIRDKIEDILYRLIKNTTIFDGCEYEIKIWLYSIIFCSYDAHIGNLITTALNITYKNYLQYCKEIMEIKDRVSVETSIDFKSIIENLSVDVYDKNKDGNNEVILSPFIIGMISTSNGVVTEYLNIALVNLLHSQTSPKVLIELVLNFSIDKHVLKYYRNWYDCGSLVSVRKIYKTPNILTKVSKYLVNEDDSFDDELNIEKYHVTLLIKMLTFYATQMLNNQIFNDAFIEKYYNITEMLLDKYFSYECLDVILKNSSMIRLFSPIHPEDEMEKLCTHYITKVIKKIVNKVREEKVINLLNSEEMENKLEVYLIPYRTILLRKLHVMLKKNKKHKKPPKNNNFMELITLLELSTENCNELFKIISKMSSECFISTENKPSAIIEVFVYLLERNIILYHKNAKTLRINIKTLTVDSKQVDTELLTADAKYEETKPFEIDYFRLLVEHLLLLNNNKIELNLEKIENSLYDYIQTFPHIVEVFHKEYFKSLLLKTTTRSSAKLSMLLLKHNLKLFDVIESITDDILEKRELVFSLTNSLIDHNISDNFLQKVYTKHETVIIKLLEKPQKAAQYLVDYYKTIIRLIEKFMSVKLCQEFALKTHKFETGEMYHIEILTAVYDKCIDEDKIAFNYIVTIMNLLIGGLKKTEMNGEKINLIVTNFINYLNININGIAEKNIDKNSVNVDKNSDSNIDKNTSTKTNRLNNFGLSKNATFQQFSKLCLKYGLQTDSKLVELLKVLCEFCNDNDEYLGMLFEMAVSHSESLNILLDNKNILKPQLIELLLTICKKNKSVINKSHIPVWLGAYEGTISSSDRNLLHLMHLYENANVGFHEYKPYLWGKAAVGHYSVRYGMETALLRQPKPVEVLDIFDVEKIKITITNFPKTRSLNPEHTLESVSDLEVYDPAFYLPLLSQLLTPESTIRWYQCKFGVIALTIIALTSDVKDIRIAACHILARFHFHLEAARYGKDRLLWLHFIEALCRSICTMEKLQMSTISGIFMSRCAIVFNRPDHTLYSALTNYIMAKDRPDIKCVPEMLELLHSHDVRYVEHRNFILQVMRDGLKSESDLKIMFRSMAFKFLMDIHNSTVMNNEGKKLILEILSNAVSISMGARSLIQNYGLLSWLYAVIKLIKRHENELLVIIINLLNNLVTSLELKQLTQVNFHIMLCLTEIINVFKKIQVDTPMLMAFIKVLYLVYENDQKSFTKNNLIDLLNVCRERFDCHICYYYLEYGNEFVKSETDDYLQLLTLKCINSNKM